MVLRESQIVRTYISRSQAGAAVLLRGWEV
jgi:hypothetical protein